LHAAQVLYFAGALLPQHYTLVMFMSDRETLPGSRIHGLGAAQIFEMADELGVTIRNPYTREPVQLVSEHAPGDFIEPDPAAPAPLRMCLQGGRILSLPELQGASPAAGSRPNQAAGEGQREKPARPPLGGRKPR
ncbi:hypothetical protein IIA79_05400, partial [bacterium]|nr:hypothetical protein [bacterium]